MGDESYPWHILLSVHHFEIPSCDLSLNYLGALWIGCDGHIPCGITLESKHSRERFLIPHMVYLWYSQSVAAGTLPAFLSTFSLSRTDDYNLTIKLCLIFKTTINSLAESDLQILIPFHFEYFELLLTVTMKDPIICWTGFAVEFGWNCVSRYVVCPDFVISNNN